MGKIIKGGSFSQQSEFKETLRNHKSTVVDLLDK